MALLLLCIQDEGWSRSKRSLLVVMMLTLWPLCLIFSGGLFLLLKILEILELVQEPRNAGNYDVANLSDVASTGSAITSSGYSWPFFAVGRPRRFRTDSVDNDDYLVPRKRNFHLISLNFTFSV